jgi:hypothetical protein
MADKAAKGKPIHLEDQYKPVQLKAVLAAALMCPDDRKKQEHKEPAQFQDKIREG